MLESGFTNYTVQKVVNKGDRLGQAEIAGGQAGVVHLIAAEDFSYSMTAEEIPQIYLSGPGFVYAPVVQGQEAGFAYVCLGDKTVGKIPLIYGETVEQEPERKSTLWDRIRLFKRGEI